MTESLPAGLPGIVFTTSETEHAESGWVSRPLTDITIGAERSARVILAEPLENLDDPWGTLREIWPRVSPGGTLTVTYGDPGGEFRLSSHDVANLLRLAGFQPIESGRSRDSRETSGRWVARDQQDFSSTVVIPCRNEIENVDNIVARVPPLGTHTELVFVDGESTDGTAERVDELIRLNPDKDIKLVRQTGNTGKGGATFQGFQAATGDVVMILDADMTVRPEDLPRFYLALAEGVADVANGSRLVYPMESGAMPGLNAAGNKLFGRYMSWLLETRITDTLCGTKAVLKRDIPCLLDARAMFGGHDPWGDFDLLMSAAHCRLSMVEIPVRYVARDAGESKMRPFAHGMALAQTALIGAVRLKFGKPAGAGPRA